MSQYFIAIVVFMTCLIVIELLLYSYRNFRNPDRWHIKKRLEKFSQGQYEGELQDILRQATVLSEVPFLNGLLKNLPNIQTLEKLRRQANSQYPLGFFILLSLCLAFWAFITMRFLFPMDMLFAVLGLFAGLLPFVWLHIKKERRLEKFKRQLPEGLDLIARSLRAGISFTLGMKMAAEHFDDPLSSEFEQALDEITYGITIEDALQSLGDRVDCADLRFFVVSVILHKDMGGNLAEIIENIATIIRERFKFQGKVRTLSAEGRISSLVLLALPFAFGIYIYIRNPDYLKILVENPGGRIAIWCAIALMVAGSLIIRRMIRIRV